LNAVVTPAQNSFTYDSIKWKAPAMPGIATFYYVAMASDNSYYYYGDYVYAGSTVTALPISLSYFTASVSNNAAILKWQTEQEINCNHFEIERSDDGQFFFAIGKINAKGTGNSKQEYQFVDDKLNTNSSNIFYRLKMVDDNGTYSYSQQQRVLVNINSDIKIKQPYPSIVSKAATMQVSINSKKNTTIISQILNTQGNVLQQRGIRLSEGLNDCKISLPNIIGSGVYFIKFFNENFAATYTIIVSK